MKKSNKIFWGVFLIIAAFIVICFPFGVFDNIGFGTLAATVLLIPIFIKSLTSLNFFGIFFSAAGLGIVYLTPFNKDFWWILLLAALLLTIGFQMLFGSIKKKRFDTQWQRNHPDQFQYHGKHSFSDNVENINGSVVNCEVSFGSSVKYLHSQSLQRANIKSSFAGAKVYFTDCIVDPNGAVIYIDSSFAGLELHIPSSWNVKQDVSSTVGAVDIVGNFSNVGPEVLLTGNTGFSGVTVFAI